MVFLGQKGRNLFRQAQINNPGKVSHDAINKELAYQHNKMIEMNLNRSKASCESISSYDSKTQSSIENLGFLKEKRNFRYKARNARIKDKSENMGIARAGKNIRVRSSYNPSQQDHIRVKNRSEAIQFLEHPQKMVSPKNHQTLEPDEKPLKYKYDFIKDKSKPQNSR